MKEKVSVIIPYFNDGAYIAETLDSVQKQTYPNIEIIIVDDGSTDEASIHKFDEIEEKNGVRKFREENSGPSAARNLGISHAEGTYILPLDADDLIESTYIEKAVKVLQNDSACGIVYCQAKFFGRKKGLWELPPFSLIDMLCHNIIFVTSLFRRTDWEMVGGYDTHMKYGIEDYEFWLSILELGRSVYRLPEVLFCYRIKQVSRNSKLENEPSHFVDSYAYILKKHRKLYDRHYEDIVLRLMKENVETTAKYEHLKSLFPFYGLFQRISGSQKARIKKWLGFKRN